MNNKMGDERILTSIPASRPRTTPQHVAIILSGDAQRESQSEMLCGEALRRGVDALQKTVREAIECGLGYLTLAVSSEKILETSRVGGWEEVFVQFIHQSLDQLQAQNVKVRFVAGNGERKDAEVRMRQAEQITGLNTGLRLILVVECDSRREIAETIRSIVREVAAGGLRPEEIDVEDITRHAASGGVPDPDLIILTSGVRCLSNCFLWQAAYAELLFLPIDWREFDETTLTSAVFAYSGRDRRFGGLSRRAS